MLPPSGDAGPPGAVRERRQGRGSAAPAEGPSDELGSAGAVFLPGLAPPAGRSSGRPARGRPRLGDDDKIISAEELGRLLGFLAARAEREEARTRAVDGPRCRDLVLVELLAGTGLRASEAARLAVRDVHLTGRNPYLRVRGGKARQRKDVDTVPLPSQIAGRLRRYVAARARHGEESPLFAAAQSGRPLGRREVWKAVKAGVRGAGLREVLNAHSLRHYFISAACQVPGSTPMLVAKLARLRDSSLVTRYFHASEDRRRAIANALRLPRATRSSGRTKRRD